MKISISNSIHKFSRYAFYLILSLTIILGFILLGWQLNKYYDYNHMRVNQKFKFIVFFRINHYTLYQIVKFICIIIFLITVFGALIIFGYYLRKFAVKNRGIYYKRFMTNRNKNRKIIVR